MFVYMQNPPFSLLCKRRLNINFHDQHTSQESYYNENEEKQILEETEQKGKSLLPFEHPCEYFIFFSIMTVWLGNYTRRKLYEFLNTINK